MFIKKRNTNFNMFTVYIDIYKYLIISIFFFFFFLRTPFGSTYNICTYCVKSVYN